jgi:hypothetical protein
MVSVILVSGFIIGVVATSLVFADTIRRDLSLRTRYLWTGSVGVVSVGGFLTAYLFDDLLFQLYLEVTGSAAIAPLPREVAITLLLIALVASAASVLTYGFGSRYGPLKAA